MAPSQLMRFLLRWQHVQPGTQQSGRDGVLETIGQLQSAEVPAPAWEEHVLPSRIRMYDPADLDSLCLSGAVTWGRLTPGQGAAEAAGHGAAGNGTQRHHAAVAPARMDRRWLGPSRAVPIAFLLRDDLPAFMDGSQDTRAASEDRAAGLRGAAADVIRYLAEHGASFLAEIARGTRRLPGEVETALWELVSLGMVTGDGLAGLRGLLQSNPRVRARHRRALALATPHALRRSLPAGRWSLWGTQPGGLSPDERDEAQARQFLRRYGVVFRDLLARERCAPPWRRLLVVYRRWEAQGEVRGGRFVSGFTGEQFALPEAVEALRAVRRGPDETQDVVISAADPLNLVGVLLPGSRVSPLSGMAIALRNGVPVDVAPHGALLARLRRAGLSGVGSPAG